MSAAATATRPDARPEGRLGRPFLAVWSAAAISSTGDGLALVALPLLAKELTDNNLLVALVYVFQRLPWLLFGITAGSVADRRDPRVMMIVADFSRALALGVLAWVVAAYANPPVMILYLVAFALGTGETYFSGAAQVTLPYLVARENLVRANGYLFSAQMSGEQVVGPSLGGWTYASFRRWIPFAGDAVSFVVSASLLRTLPRIERDPARARMSLREDVRVALAYFRADRLLKVTTALIASIAFAQAMVLSLLAIYITDALEISKRWTGLFFGLFAAGNIVGGILAHRVLSRVRPHAALVGGFAIVGVSYVVSGLFLHPVIGVAALATEAFVIAVLNVQNRTLRQTHVPRHMIGKLANLIRMCIFGAQPLGALLGGLIAQRWEVETAFVVSGFLCFIPAIAGSLTLRAVFREVEWADAIRGQKR